MKIVVYNPEPIAAPEWKPFYKCNVCGIEKFWGDEHAYIERPTGLGYCGYDAMFVICSNECRRISKEYFIKWLSQLDGWNKKTATENYEKYVRE